MTISSTSNKVQFNGSGTTGPFAFTFKTFAQADLVVISTSPTGVETTLTLTADYSVSLNADQNNNPGGTVTTVAAVASGYKLTIIREVDALQETDITNGGGFYPEVIENSLDRLTMLVQQNAEAIERAVLVDITSGADPTTLIGDLQTAATTASAAAVTATAAKNFAEAAQVAAEAAAASVPLDGLVPADIGVVGGVQAYDADTAKLDVEQAWSAQQTAFDGTLTDGATIDWNGDSNGQIVSVTLGGNRTLNAPTNINENALYVLTVIQDGTGGRTLGWNAAYKFPGGTVPTVTATAGAVDVFSFIGGAGNTLRSFGQDVK